MKLHLANASQSFCEVLNAAVSDVRSVPRVRFDAEVAEDAERWIKKKHANGAIHEPATIAAFLACARTWPDMRVIFDCGSLFGYFSILAGMLFAKADVTAFEMHPSAVNTLVKNMWPGSLIVPVAIDNRPHRRGIKVWISAFNIYEEPADGWEALENEPGAMKPRGHNNSGRGFAKIDFMSIDSYCISEGVRPDLIKIDVEAYQTKAVLGAMETIARNRPVLIMELHDPEKTSRMKTTNAETVQPLFDIGYEVFWCGNHRDMDARFEQVTAMGPEHEKLSIVVCVPR